MSLDQNLFTLLVTPHPDDPNVIDLVDPTGRPHYRKQRIAGPIYKLEVYDPLSEALLITVTAPSAASKHKTLELCNPTSVIELNYTGTIKFRWSFKWEDHEFEWKREECFMLRKPDPPVLVAVTKEPPGRLKTTSIQILDYNLNRFDIDDRKGLEIVILTALLSFLDANEAYHTPDATPLTTAVSTPRIPTERKSSAPVPPPKPAPKTGVARIAEMQRSQGEYNEVFIQDEGSVEDYAQHCSNLLQDDALLFVTLKSAEAEQVPKVLKVVEQTKRMRHKAGEEEELQQYVLYDTVQPAAKKGPRRIVLDDLDGKGKPMDRYAPPNTLTVHLSKIDMPELRPKAAPQAPATKPADKSKKDKPVVDRNKKEAKGKSSSPDTTSPPPNRLSKPHVHAHQTHPNQPSPSPSQLNNPGIYVAPPPRHSRYPSSSTAAGPPPITLPRPNSLYHPATSAAAYAPPPPPPGHYPIYAPEPYGNSNNMLHIPGNSGQATAPSRPVTPSDRVVAGINSMFSELPHRR